MASLKKQVRMPKNARSRLRKMDIVAHVDFWHLGKELELACSYDPKAIHATFQGEEHIRLLRIYL